MDSNRLDWRGKSAGAIIAAILLLSVFAPYLTPYGPIQINLEQMKLAPGEGGHLLGTDQKGRDMLARILAGGKTSIGVAVLAALVSMAIGLCIGLSAGYFGGRVDMALVSMADLVLSFPSLLLAIGISVVLPPGTYTSMLAIASVGWASFARLIRGHVLKLRTEPYIDAARAIGCGHARIIFVHLLPQCVPLGLVMMGLKIGGFILTEASLSFLGLGTQPPAPSWGAMISSSRAYMLAAPWMTVAPGLAIMIAALSFNVLGDALSEKSGIKPRN